MFIHSHWQWPASCAWTLVKCLLIWYSLKVNQSAPWLQCRFFGGALQLMHSMCKLFCALPFMLLYYIIIMQWLVGSGIKAKRGLCQQKSALWPCASSCTWAVFSKVYFVTHCTYYPAHACTKGLSNRFCPSVSLSVCQSVQWKILKSEYRQG